MISGYYFSWGWEKSAPQGKVIPGPASVLAGRKSIGADNGRNGILLATTTWSLHLIYVPFHPMHFSNYLSWQFQFIKALDLDLISALHVRLRRCQLGWDLTVRWTDRYPEIILKTKALRSQID